jgi:hypothetical protein
LLSRRRRSGIRDKQKSLLRKQPEQKIEIGIRKAMARARAKDRARERNIFLIKNQNPLYGFRYSSIS